MKRNIVLLTFTLALVAAACAGDDSDSAEATTAPTSTSTTAAPTTTTEAASEGGAVFTMVEVGLGAAEQYVVIQNIGDASGNLQGFAICQAPTYHSFVDIEVAPGELVFVSLGGDLPELASVAKETVIASIGSISVDDGEIGLYSESRKFGNSDAIIDYVEWGDSGHTRSVVAIGAGIWNSGDFVVTTSDTNILIVTDASGSGADNWEAG